VPVVLDGTDALRQAFSEAGDDVDRLVDEGRDRSYPRTDVGVRHDDVSSSW
jgi:hypothetical protein